MRVFSAAAGHWTLEWQGTKKEKIEGVTTLLDGFVQCAENYNLTIITDPQKADEADVVLLAVGEKPYAEYEGDSDHPDLLGKHGLEGNLEAMEEIKRLNKPVIACMISRVIFGSLSRGTFEAINAIDCMEISPSATYQR